MVFYPVFEVLPFYNEKRDNSSLFPSSFDLLEAPFGRFYGQNGGNSKDISVSLPLEGLSSDDVEVKVEDGMLKIKGEKVEKDEKGEIVSSRSVTKIVSLPSDCIADKMEKKIGEDGVLRINIPRDVKQMAVETDKSKKELANIDVFGYNPEDITVEVSQDGKFVTVSGKHVEKSDRANYTIQFSRVFEVDPKEVDMSQVKTDFDANSSKLSITAPVHAKAASVTNEEEPKRKIPIRVETQ